MLSLMHEMLAVCVQAWWFCFAEWQLFLTH